MTGIAPRKSVPPGWLANDALQWPVVWTGAFTDQDSVEAGSSGERRWLVDGLRAEQSAAGLSALATERFPDRSVQSLELPEHLDGGFLFVSTGEGETSLWFAREWTGTLEGVVRFRGNVDWMGAGFDQIYLREALTGRIIGVDRDPWQLAAVRGLPPAAAFRDIVIVDAFFGAVSGDPFGVRVTFDAGASWQTIETNLPARPHLARAGDRLSITGGSAENITIDRRGYRTDGAAPDAHRLARGGGPPRPLIENPVREAILHGVASGTAKAIFAVGGHVAEVDLGSGRLLRAVPNAYPGVAPCTPFPWGNELGLACGERRAGTDLYIVQRDLSLALVHSWPDGRRVLPNGRGDLLVSGGCQDGNGALTERYCSPAPDGTSFEFALQPGDRELRPFALGAKVLGGLIPPQAGVPGKLVRVSHDGRSERRLAFQDPATEARASAALWLSDVTVLTDQGLGAWLELDGRFAGVTIDAEGRVEWHAAKGLAVRESAFFHGLAAHFNTETGTVMESSDFGRSWSKVGELPYLHKPALASALVSAPIVGCSALGCTYGPFQHYGFRPAPDAETQLATPESPEEGNINPPLYEGWQFDCEPTAARQTGEAQVSLPGLRLGRREGFDENTKPSAPLNPGSRPVDFEVWSPLAGPPSTAAVRWQKNGTTNTPYRAFVWSPGGPDFRGQSGWLVHVLDRFDGGAPWATAPTMAPWVTAEQAHAVFGSTGHPAERWEVEPSSSSAAALLLTGTGEQAQLHILEEGQPIQSFASAGVRTLSGAARVDGVWHFGQQDGDRFTVYRVGADGPQLAATLPLGIVTSHGVLIGTKDESQLGLLVRSLTGSWYLYPLDKTLKPLTVYPYSREALSTDPEPCDGPESGFVAVATLPPSRLEPPSTAPLGIDGVRATDLRGRLRLRPNRVCVESLHAATAVLPQEMAPAVAANHEKPFPLILNQIGSSKSRRLRCQRR